MTTPVVDKRPATITVWACATCGYWREKKETGIHVSYEGNGPGVRHELVPTIYRS